ncbi:GMC oxidoreductase [soil metagenome]
MADLEVDVCIIGSGPAGAILASQLIGRGKRIAIIEQGAWNDAASQQTRMDAGYAAQISLPAPHLHVPMSVRSSANYMYFQVKKVGGNSRLWGGWTPRGLEQQFTMQTSYQVGVDWPIGYAELEPYYARAEEELGVGGEARPDDRPWRSGPYPLPPIEVDYAGKLFGDACERLGYGWERVQVARPTVPYRGRPACRACNITNCMCCPTTARYKSDVHLAQVLTDPDAVLLTETIAARLERGDNGRIRALRCFKPDRSEQTIVASTFVVAANAVGNAHLLLMSELPAQSAALGRYYMGHPVIEHLAQVDRSVLAARSPFTVVSRHFESGEHLREAAGFRMFINGADLSPTMHGLRLVDQGMYGAPFKSALKERSTRGMRTSVVTDCLPHADNRVELDRDNVDHFGRPGLRVTYNYTDYEQRGRELGARHMRHVLAEMGATEISEATYDMAHQIGTTRMGDDPTTSVVDRELRVHGVDNLYVAGASVFPTALGATNPTLTLSALSLRLARHMRERGVA